MKAHLAILFILLFQLLSHAQVSDFESINFTRANNIARQHKGANLNNLSLLAHKLTHNLPTEVEKFRAIYTWVCANVKGDNTLQTKVSWKRNKLRNDSILFLQWNNEYKKVIFKKLLKHKKTMCTGYAYLIKELCYLANIECVIVAGYGRLVDANVNEFEIANHSWNAVKLNKKWYLADATWSSGYMNGNGNFIKEYNDGYFLSDPILFGKNHYPLKQKWLLNNTLTASEFITVPLIYGESFEQDVTPLHPQEMNVSAKKNEAIRFSFKSSKKISNKQVALVYYIVSQENMFETYDFTNEDGVVSFNTKFKHKGTYDIHLKVNDDIVATYTLSVKK